MNNDIRILGTFQILTRTYYRQMENIKLNLENYTKLQWVHQLVENVI